MIKERKERGFKRIIYSNGTFTDTKLELKKIKSNYQNGFYYQ